MPPLEQCPLDGPGHGCALYLEVHKHPQKDSQGLTRPAGSHGAPPGGSALGGQVTSLGPFYVYIHI